MLFHFGGEIFGSDFRIRYRLTTCNHTLSGRKDKAYSLWIVQAIDEAGKLFRLILGALHWKRHGEDGEIQCYAHIMGDDEVLQNDVVLVVPQVISESIQLIKEGS